MQTEFGLRQTTDAMFRRRGLTPIVVLESAEIATIRGLVASGLGVSIVPGGPHAPTSPDLVIVPLADEDAYRSIGLCWHADRELPHAVRRFREYTAEPARRGPTYGLAPSGVRRSALDLAD